MLSNILFRFSTDGIHGLDFGGVARGYHRPFDFQCVGELARLHGERLGQEGEFLDTLKAGKTFLKPFYALGYHGAYLTVLHQVFEAVIGYLFASGILLEGLVGRDDDCCDIFALVADDGHLLYVLVLAKTALKGKRKYCYTFQSKCKENQEVELGMDAAVFF